MKNVDLHLLRIQNLDIIGLMIQKKTMKCSIIENIDSILEKVN